MGGQIVDATLVAAPKQRNTATEKEAIKAGKSAAEIWPDQPAKAAKKDTDARWTLKFAKARALPDGRPGIDIAIPSFGYKNSIAICRRYGPSTSLRRAFIRRGKVTDGARFDGRMLRDVVTSDNTASDVWADTAYRSRSNEAWLTTIGRVSHVHAKKPRGKPMSARTARANAAGSTVRARIEHVFARQKVQMGLFICTIGIARAEAKIKVYPYLLRKLAVTRPNQVWATDITYIPMARGFVYLVAIVDWFTRRVLAWRVSISLDAGFCIEALEEALTRYGKPAIFNSDQGSQFTSATFTAVLHREKIAISMDGKGCWRDNVFVERLWRSVKYEEVYLNAYASVPEARAGIGRYLAFYNTVRPHSALGGRTPNQLYFHQPLLAAA